MLILALDTSSQNLGLALVKDGQLLAERSLVAGSKHSLTLLPQLEELLTVAGVDFSALEAFAVTTGPGSYTGIRIGLATAKSWAWQTDKPLYAFSSLALMLAPYRAMDAFFLPALDARSGRTFSCLYRGGQRLLPEANRYGQDLMADLKALFYLGRKSTPTLYLLGDGAPAIQAAYDQDPEAAQHFALEILDPSVASLRPYYLGLLAQEAADRGEKPSWQEAAANYCAPTQAERVRLEHLAQVQIRPAGLEDLDTIHQIERAVFSTPWSRKALIHQLSPENRDAKLFLIYLPQVGGETEKAERVEDPTQSTEEILGYGGYYLHVDEAEILNIAILPDHRHQGLGQKLLAGLMADAKSQGAQRLTLEVRKSNEAARKLYASQGFLPCGERKNYYDKPREDALILEAQL